MSGSIAAREGNVKFTQAAFDIAYASETAKVLYDGGIRPAGVANWQGLFARIHAGHEVGLKPMQAINQIMVMNGKTGIYGDAGLALVRESGRLEEIEERIDGEGDTRVGVCRTKRVGEGDWKETRFSVSDAKLAGLWKKAGPWTTYPERMLTFRARSWALRDGFGDVLLGLGIAEEMQDFTEGKTKPQADAPTVTQVVTPQTLQLMAVRRDRWMFDRGIDTANKDAVAEAWGKLLAVYGVTKAAELTPEQGASLLLDLAKPPEPQLTAGEFFTGLPEAAAIPIAIA